MPHLNCSVYRVIVGCLLRSFPAEYPADTGKSAGRRNPTRTSRSSISRHPPRSAGNKRHERDQKIIDIMSALGYERRLKILSLKVFWRSVCLFAFLSELIIAAHFSKFSSEFPLVRAQRDDRMQAQTDTSGDT